MRMMSKYLEKEYDRRHGGPFDRGSADSYYQRGGNPHYYAGATYSSERVEQEQMTMDEIEAYWAGYYENEDMGSFKDYD